MQRAVVRGDEPREVPGVTQRRGLEELVVAGEVPVDHRVGAHRRGRLRLLHRGLERRQVDLLQRAVVDDDVVLRGIAVRLLVVDGVVLHLVHLTRALQAVDLAGGQRHVQVRVLGVGLERPAPARVAVDVDRRPQVDGRALADLLGPDHLAVLAGLGGVEGGGQGDAGGQLGDAGQAVGHAVRPVFLAQARDAEAGMPAM